MKKRFLVTAGLLSTLAAGSAHAERHYGLAGCGLGSLIIDKNSGYSAQSSAAISNGFAYNQLFGITSGTSNCVPSGSKVAEELHQQDFFVANFSTLSKDIARGQGDALVAFAGTLGCTSGASTAVAKHLHADYATIFGAPGAVAAFDVAKDSLRTVPGLANDCASL